MTLSPTEKRNFYMLFRNSYMTPGPGVERDTPRKTGLPRFFELLGRDLPNLYKASFLAGLGGLPAILLVGFGISTKSILITLGGAILTGWLVGPCLCGAFDTTLRALRDEAGYWWPTYRRAFKANFKGSLLSGIVFTAIVSIQVLVCTTLLEGGVTSVFTWVMMVLNLFLGTGFFSYYWAQMVLVDTTLSQRIKNSCLMFIGFLPQTLAATVLQLFYWALLYLLMPFSIILFLAFGCWLPLLVGLMIIYPSMDRVLHIEETLYERHKDDYKGEIDWGNPEEDPDDSQS